MISRITHSVVCCYSSCIATIGSFVLEVRLLEVIRTTGEDEAGLRDKDTLKFKSSAVRIAPQSLLLHVRTSTKDIFYFTASKMAHGRCYTLRSFSLHRHAEQTAFTWHFCHWDEREQKLLARGTRT